MFGLMVYNTEKGYFKKHFHDILKEMNFHFYTADPDNRDKNYTDITEMCSKNNYKYLIITAGSIPLKISQLRKINIPIKILFLTDDDWQFYPFSRFYSREFEQIITTYESNLQLYKNHRIENVMFMQWGVNTNVFKPLAVEKKYDVSFIGAPHSDRIRLARHLINNGINIKLFGSGWEKTELNKHSGGYLTDSKYLEVLNQTKIIIAPLKSGDETTLQLKGRLFETAACRAFQIAEKNTDVYKYYNKDEIVTYDDYDELVKKINYYLPLQEERERIASNAYKRTLKEYSWQNKIHGLFELGSYKKSTSKPSGSVTIIYIINDNEVLNRDTITSINSQSYENITVAIVSTTDIAANGIKYNINKYSNCEEAFNGITSEYISFVYNGDILDENIIELQIYALENDKSVGIDINVVNYSLYEGNNREIFYYSYSSRKQNSNCEEVYPVILSSLLIRTETARANKGNLLEAIPNGILLGIPDSSSAPIHSRHIDLQYCLVSLPVSRFRYIIRNYKSEGTKLAGSCHWIFSSRKEILYLLLHLKIMPIIYYLTAYLKKKPLIKSYLLEYGHK